ncbi:MAG: hypothetical protein KME07_07300 [Pegethrix bostrychoides GSE-TBD4-15B]|jgi:uncharacterized coiled-coil protein SlyX|uniref:Uncharacterized protein n=1 Tax=Pegethrix bostrychoides GSE-TBD4-15B TaxID=2839662 RepID=A0A951P954_9CYAN|nr:hypothetical protein [Pegethrix bostrychoides GSE-TBD4-15B]
MNSAEVQSQILAFIVYSIPLIVALWKIFSWLESIQDSLEQQIREVDRRLLESEHRATLKSSQIEALNDKVALAVNGVKELVNHLRTRTKNDDEHLHQRLAQVERYLSKTTDFQSRD